MKMSKFGRILLIVWFLAAPSQMSFSAEKIILTLEDSIQLALSQNPLHLATEKRVEGAKYKVNEAVAGFLPSLNAQGQNTLDEKVFELEIPSFVPGEPSQRVPFDFTRDYQVAFSVSLPLFTGGRLMAGLRQAKYNLLSTEESLRQSRQDTVFNTKQAFYGILLAREFVKVAEEAVAVAQKNYSNVKSLYEVGMASKLDLLRSEVRLADLKPQLIKAKNGLRIAELGLKSLLGMDLAQEVEVRGDLSYTPVEPDGDECLIKALQHRPEIKQIGYQKKIAGEMVKIARAERLPSVSLAGTYNFWADQFSFNKDTWQSFYAVNLVLTVPIFNGLSSFARAAQSKALIKELEFNQKGIVDAIEFEVRQAILNLEEARETLLSQEKNVEQAQESLRIAQLSFSEGLVTSLDVIAAEATLTQVKTNYSQALYDYVISLAELDKAMGIGWEEGEE